MPAELKLSRSEPRKSRRSLPNPLSAVRDALISRAELRAVRVQTKRVEEQAQRVSDAIESDIGEDLRSRRFDLRMVVVGQSGSGKSTVMKQWQLKYDRPTFEAERVAWRSVVHLNLLQSINHILEVIAEPLHESDATCNTFDSDIISLDPEAREKHAFYSELLAPLRELESRLIQTLMERDEDQPPEDETTLVGDDERPSSRAGADVTCTNTRSVSTNPLPSRLLTIKATPNWNKTFAVVTTKLGGALDWRKDSTDQIHVLLQCKSSMEQLWADPWIRNKLQERRASLEERGGYFLDDIDRITAADYIPTNDDVLKAHLPTVGIHEHTLQVVHHRWPNLKLSEIGFLHAQRQAWIPFVDSVNTLIFIAPISRFDEVLAGDPPTNCLQQSLSLWRQVVSSPLLRSVNIFLFLNKCDVLKAKLDAGRQVKDYIPEFGDRPCTFESVTDYLYRRFHSICNEETSFHRLRMVHIFFTSVTNSTSSNVVLSAVQDSTMREVMYSCVMP
ncbi:P-loop containing nucleoside triphosphate hydrolase protein [Artomyces pyxidatus]|uniref:P-loop containing nucleoside triphosphate hydrolase protein n=1 Tax=Artomyces pyxidatus TaxID=48021 RepID=A0ACB8SN76_9AGAM|nr:P-loop containing nucleoside triphosphate hydrolase protein [Artomyces pyxidatus]